MAPHESQDKTASTPVSPRPRRRFLAGVLTGGLLGSLLAGSASVFSLSHAERGWWRGGHGGWGHHRHGAGLTGERAEFVADWMLSRIQASDDQKRQIKTLLQETLETLQPLREQHQQNRQALLATLVQPAIDREVLRTLRQAELQLAEEASQHFVDTMANIAEVLTPEQRATLVDMVNRFHQ